MIVVLAKGVNNDGTLTDETRRNVEKALELQRKNAQRILMCGRWSYTYSSSPLKTEAQAMREYAIELGAKEISVLKEEKSADTLGNAFFAKKIIKELGGVDSLIIIAVDYHLNRSRYIFKKVFWGDFKLSFVGVKSHLSKEELLKKLRFEDETLSFLEHLMDNVEEGDDKRLELLFETLHPVYSKDPNTVPEWVWAAFEAKGVSRGALLERYHKNRSRSV